jgi:hypothetical protein
MGGGDFICSSSILKRLAGKGILHAERGRGSTRTHADYCTVVGHLWIDVMQALALSVRRSESIRPTQPPWLDPEHFSVVKTHFEWRTGVRRQKRHTSSSILEENNFPIE